MVTRTQMIYGVNVIPYYKKDPDELEERIKHIEDNGKTKW